MSKRSVGLGGRKGNSFIMEKTRTKPQEALNKKSQNQAV